MFSATIEYSEKALEPFLSPETINYHYGKHHIGYANTLNSMIENTEFKKLSLDQMIIKTRNHNPKIFNNAAQLFNHDFFWRCLKNFSELPSAKLLNLVNNQFGDFDKFRNEYITFAGTMFGSGWSWLVEENGVLKFLNTANAENPIGSESTPLCVVDLWEHAYYIDYRNNRAEYIKKVVMNCINWNFCESQLQ